MEDASEDQAKLSISATAVVKVLSDCDMALKVGGINVLFKK